MEVRMAAGILLGLVLMIGIGLWSGRRVKSAEDFEGRGRAGSLLVAGTIMGTMVGGASTVGTAQLAFTYGLSAWWFTLGAGLACLTLGLGFIKPLRRMSTPTAQGLLTREYGPRAGMLASTLSCLGLFVNIIPQIISGAAVLAILFPKAALLPASIIVAALMAVYVFFGGTLGAGMSGLVKLVLLYSLVIVVGGIALKLGGGLGAFYQSMDHGQFFNLVSRGAGVDVGGGLSVVFGILATQTYIQAVRSGRTDRAAQRGALAGAVLIPPIGAGGILVGLYMRQTAPAAVLADPVAAAAMARTAFPRFILDQLPPFAAGLAMATLLITVVGAGAGILLGVSTVIDTDIIRRLTHRFEGPRAELFLSRATILLLMAVAVVCTMFAGDAILDFSFLALGLRASVIFVPLCCAMFLPGRVSGRFAAAAFVAGPAAVMLSNGLALPFDPLFCGLGASAALMAAGLAVGRKRVPGELSAE